MKAAELAKAIDAIAAIGQLEAEVHDVTHDSRRCVPGGIFVAIRGEKMDAHRFISQALEGGAIGVISERSPYVVDDLVDSAVVARVPVWLQVTNAREALAQAGAAVHLHPSRRLKLVGITGTNGKTTTAHLIDSIIRAAEGVSAMFGTITYRIGEETTIALNTTPEAADLQRMLAQAVDKGCRSAVMEVSSHAIDLHRADALKFAVAVFTNLTRDHLDYHKTLEGYFTTKERLFNGGLSFEPSISVLNIDDEYGRRLLNSARGKVLIPYGLQPTADVFATDFKSGVRGLQFNAMTPAGQVEIVSELVGRPHVYNILAAVASGLALGFGPADIAVGIRECPVVAGRFEQVTVTGAPPSFTVIVDYAHSDDALKNTLQTAREVAGNDGRIITVFGCGGDRDRTKRAIMGEVAGTLSDITIVTSDNPRSEDPEAIIEEIEVGLRTTGRTYFRTIDRREAIFQAVNEARKGDVVIIAGKGHETYQIIGNRTIHFDDREVAREALKKRN